MEPNKPRRAKVGRLDNSLVKLAGAPHHENLGCDGPTMEIREKARETHHFGEKWEKGRPQGFWEASSTPMGCGGHK